MLGQGQNVTYRFSRYRAAPPVSNERFFLSPFNNEAKGHTKRMDENTNQMVPRNKH